MLGILQANGHVHVKLHVSPGMGWTSRTSSSYGKTQTSIYCMENAACLWLSSRLSLIAINFKAFFACVEYRFRITAVENIHTNCLYSLQFLGLLNWKSSGSRSEYNN